MKPALQFSLVACAALTVSNLAASPMSYAINGRQFVTIAAGNAVHTFALPDAR